MVALSFVEARELCMLFFFFSRRGTKSRSRGRTESMGTHTKVALWAKFRAGCGALWANTTTDTVLEPPKRKKKATEAMSDCGFWIAWTTALVSFQPLRRGLCKVGLLVLVENH